jgi:hypothetical protein
MQKASGFIPLRAVRTPIRPGAQADPARRSAFGPMPRWEFDAAGFDIEPKA